MWGLVSYEHMYIRKHTDNCCRCSGADNWPCLAPALLLLTLKKTHAHTHTNAQQTKCPFQRRRGDGVRPRPPKSQTKVHPCCGGQNLPFCQPSRPTPRSRPILELDNRPPNTRGVCQPRWRVGWRGLTFGVALDQRLVAAIVGFVLDADATIQRLSVMIWPKLVLNGKPSQIRRSRSRLRDDDQFIHWSRVDWAHGSIKGQICSHVFSKNFNSTMKSAERRHY